MSSSKRRDPAQTWWEVIGHCPGQICLQCAVGHQPGLSHQKPPSSPQKSGHKSLYSVHGDINSLARAEVHLLCHHEDTHTMSSAVPIYGGPTTHSLHSLKVRGHQGKCSQNLSLRKCHFMPPSLTWITTLW